MCHAWMSFVQERERERESRPVVVFVLILLLVCHGWCAIDLKCLDDGCLRKAHLAGPIKGLDIRRDLWIIRWHIMMISC